MNDFREFFETATGWSPYEYQMRLALGGLPAVVQAPTGTGKTGIVLAWLWRRLHGPDPAGTPRRLVYALPQRSLVEQVAAEVAGWLERLGLAGEIAMHVVMGGTGAAQWQWRQDMHEPAIVIGTVDSLVSKALIRGYGIGRATYPIDFALVTNGAHWVIDEIQLCPESTTTLRQLAAFARSLGTAEPFGLTCMSATVPEWLIRTVDNPALAPDDVVTIAAAERVGELAVRLGASRTVRRLPAQPGDYRAIANFAAERHQPGTLTILVLNTVEAATQVYAGLPAGDAERTLIHSRFRGRERAALARKVAGPPGDAGHIVVATQVVEAGLDLNAATLVTEAAPWPSIVQRAGRCNRTGRLNDPQLWWIAPAKHQPYEEPDLAASVAELESLEGSQVSGEELLRRNVAVTEPQIAVLRRPDLIGLFDTAPDLSGADIDVAPYVRDADDLDAQLIWAMWTPELVDGQPAGDGRPAADAKAPADEWRCRAPLSKVAALAKRVAVWRIDQVRGRWTRVTPQERARPGEVLLVAAADGGYAPATGFDPASKQPVADYPTLDPVAKPAAGAEDMFSADSASVAQGDWVSLRQHSEDTREQAIALLESIEPTLPVAARNAVACAAYLHDTGKSHQIWQDALCNLATPDEKARIDAERPWAKSNRDGRLRFAGGVAFRHELASLLLLDGPLGGLIDPDADAGLVRYLVLAHHGKLRVQVRDPDQASDGVLLGLRHGDVYPVPSLLGHPEAELRVDLEPFSLGGERSWTRSVLALRDRYGPFVLAYLETLVRVADWRASAGSKVAR
ncbi:MAG TPA: CRISPR-associated helicase Cas3' [Streptosporangiaceae bacterium]|nr:CRISPR-associated helicase Cas3' [Streptosporangiaceae bacterium]